MVEGRASKDGDTFWLAAECPLTASTLAPSFIAANRLEHGELALRIFYFSTNRKLLRSVDFVSIPFFIAPEDASSLPLRDAFSSLLIWPLDGSHPVL